MRLGTFLSLVLAGLRKERQQAVWISDQDETLEGYSRSEYFATLVSDLTCAMAGWTNPATMEFGTTALDSDDRCLEDLTAVPDLAAGALAHLAPLIAIPPTAGTSVDILNRGLCTDTRTRAITDWLANGDSELKRIMLRVSKDHDGAMRARAECFRFTRRQGVRTII